jgi:hypothetical protein
MLNLPPPTNIPYPHSNNSRVTGTEGGVKCEEKRATTTRTLVRRERVGEGGGEMRNAKR